MSNRFGLEKSPKDSNLGSIVGILLLLAGVGVVVLFSASYPYAGREFYDPFHFFGRQSVYLVLGTVLAVALSFVSTAALRKYVPMVLVVTFVLLGLTFVPGIGGEVNGGRRWIYPFGYSFQPSELAKVAIILYLSHMLAKNESRVNDIVNAILPPLIVLAGMVALVYLQNDFSTAIFILFLGLSLFFIARVPFTYFLYLASASLPLSLILLFTKEHRVERLIAFLRPDLDPVGKSYQILASQSALRRGGLWGTGIGQGIKKLGGLPEGYADFIFAVLGEELGFLGVVFVLGLFVAFAVKGYGVALARKDRFEYYLAFGITTSIVYQMLFNVAVVAGLVPATGIPMPFFSHGGSSLLITLAMSGLLVGLARRPSDG